MSSSKPSSSTPALRSAIRLLPGYAFRGCKLTFPGELVDAAKLSAGEDLYVVGQFVEECNYLLGGSVPEEPDDEDFRGALERVLWGKKAPIGIDTDLAAVLYIWKEKKYTGTIVAVDGLSITIKV